MCARVRIGLVRPETHGQRVTRCGAMGGVLLLRSGGTKRHMNSYEAWAHECVVSTQAACATARFGARRHDVGRVDALWVVSCC